MSNDVDGARLALSISEHAKARAKFRAGLATAPTLITPGLSHKCMFKIALSASPLCALQSSAPTSIPCDLFCC